jgi:hypothetical protein
VNGVDLNEHGLQLPKFGDSGDDLRAMIAYYHVRVYRVASRVGMHPSTLARYLHNAEPLTVDLAAAIKEAVVAERADLVMARSR